MAHHLEPEIVELIEEIVARRLREELDARAQLVNMDAFNEAMERIDQRLAETSQRFEALQVQINQGFTEDHRRFEAIQAQMDQRFEAQQAQVDQRFEAQQAQEDQRFDNLEARTDAILQVVQDIRSQLGTSFEQFARNVVGRILEGEGYPNVILAKKHFTDASHVVYMDSEDVEIDGYADDPAILMESTAILRDKKKIETFLRKKQVIEEQTGHQFRGFFVASGSELPSTEVADLVALLRQNQCELINL
ncbi:MAG TPA: hypothetical protein VKK79_21495 [Candidatus Lokiarchaeia archaeon]|nr:hypothetical protein [Candidatus Lokiarchaeia archaeon]